MPIRLPVPPRTGYPPDRRSSSDCVTAQRSSVNRRTALRLAGGGTVGVLALGAVSGCGDQELVHEPDPLATQEVLARTDAANATAAIALAPQLHDALSTIAAERTAHADALRAEIDRVIGVYGDGTTPEHRTRTPEPGLSQELPETPAPTTGSGTPVSPPTIQQLRDQLNTAMQSAAAVARTQSGYRAGLLASISAACAAQVGVLLG